MKSITLAMVWALCAGLGLAWAQEKSSVPYWRPPTLPADPPASPEMPERFRLFLDKARVDSLLQEYKLLSLQLHSGQLTPRWQEIIQNASQSTKEVVQCFTKSGQLVGSITCESWKDKPCQHFIQACLTVGGVVVIADQTAQLSTSSDEASLLEEAAKAEDTPAPKEKAPSQPVLFPNPTQGTATLRLPESRSWTIHLYNSLGQLVATYSFTGTETSLALPPQKGLYWVLVEGADQTHRLPLLRE